MDRGYNRMFCFHFSVEILLTILVVCHLMKLFEQFDEAIYQENL